MWQRFQCGKDIANEGMKIRKQDAMNLLYNKPDNRMRLIIIPAGHSPCGRPGCSASWYPARAATELCPPPAHSVVVCEREKARGNEVNKGFKWWLKCYRGRCRIKTILSIMQHKNHQQCLTSRYLSALSVLLWLPTSSNKGISARLAANCVDLHV